MIEFNVNGESINERDDFWSADYELRIDGENLPKVKFHGSKKVSEKLTFEIYTNDIYSGEKLLSQKITDFPNFVYFSVPFNFNLLDFRTFITIYNNQNAPKLSEIDFYFDAKLLEWNQGYSFSEFEESLYSVISENTDEKIEVKIYNSQDETKFVVRTEHDFGNKCLFDELTSFIEICRSIYFETRKRSLDSKTKNSITGYFDFPEELKINCEQYLLYFAQFLRDLVGIDTISNLKEEAGKVLFSVTPTDETEALDKIREALAVYLNLPASPIVYDESFAAMRLQQQVENLQHSQKMAVREIRSAERELRLTQTVIEHQDKIIVQKDSIIEQQNKVIEKIESKSIMMDSLENKAEFEKVFDGLEFGESKELKEKLGIKFNPVTSLKTLGKKLLGKDDEFTSLNLDKEDAE